MTNPTTHRSGGQARARLATIAISVTAFAAGSLAAQDACFDQTNTVTVAGGYVIPGSSPVGQEFVPTEHSIDTVELQINAQTSTPGSARVRIRQGSITGTILGVSLPVTVAPPALPVQRTRFSFTLPVEVTPGSTHVIEVEHLAGGALGVFLTGFGADTYPLGTAIQFGASRPADDLWFREGRLRVVSVPDQSNVGPYSSGFALPTAGLCGQEFVPTQSTIEVVDLLINAQGAGTTTARVRIRRNTITGPLLGTSDPVTATGTTVREEHFHFPTPVTVTPGARHVVEVVYVSGTRLGVFATATASYAGGRSIFMGAPRATDDLWFEVGLERICDVCQRSLGFAGPGTASAMMCGSGLNAGQVSDYLLADGPPSSFGVLALSYPGQPNIPFAGGTLVSGAGLVVSLPIATDNIGRFAMRLSGTAAVFDLVAQSVAIDPSIATGLAFSNALLLEFGRP
ncbi:MAG: hypothetical protein R3F56_10405 [Planctomycetota bacterium]